MSQQLFYIGFFTPVTLKTASLLEDSPGKPAFLKAAANVVWGGKGALVKDMTVEQ